MRDVADAARIRRFMRALGVEADVPARVYFTGGATAVLLGWRASTIDVDIKMVPETDRLFRAIPQIKESLHLNVELASPADFVPVRAGWEERSPFIAQDGRVAFHHFELCAQALAKTERSHRQDVEDLREMIGRGLVTPTGVWEYFGSIESDLYRYPALDPRSFKKALEEIFGARPASQP